MKPVICNYYLTYRCNARCGFCVIWKDGRIPETRESPPAVVCRNCEDARILGVKVVDFTGGEPLLYEGLRQVLKYAKSIGFMTTLTTNGILYPLRVNEIAGLVNILQFSLDGADEDTHDAVKGVPCFRRVMESVDLARTAGERPTFIHTITDDNFEGVADVTALARKLKVPLYLSPCFAYSGNKGLSRKRVTELERLAQGRGVTVDRGYLSLYRDGGNKVESPQCRAVSSVIVISPDDRLILPCFHYKTRELPIKGRLIALRNSAEVREEMRKEGSYPFCEGCTVYCYLRASLFRRFGRYALKSYLSALKYIIEYYRVSGHRADTRK